MTDAPEPPAVAATRAKCQYAEVEIAGRRARLDPVITPEGQLNSLQSVSPRTPGGGHVLVVVEPIHGALCPAVMRGSCSCGAQEALEAFVFGTAD